MDYHVGYTARSCGKCVVLMLDDLNTTARTLGYLTLLIWMICIIWFTLTISRRIVHDWRKKRYQEKEWDNRHSDWVFNRKATNYSRHDTDTLDFDIEEVYDYQKEQYRGTGSV